MKDIKDWLDRYDALDAKRKEVQRLFDAANEGEGRFEDADSKRFDLWEVESNLAEDAATLLRELHKNSTLPEKWWVHLGGDPCFGEISQELPGVGICEHDRRVNLVYTKDGRPAR